ncbi:MULTISPECIES: hypothetical protein [Snodgrassella]|uniref:hypothetical protein n=1 Tax=Snodgrassella TaxID=1193515 RepID=UPI0015841224|nr:MULTISPECIES: hypothetical protein [unclassified Snodgrassella]MBI0098342.1 hypothetical protein [Snodgrassella sp. W8134]MBI0102133.1 hypothetical protein [Snodgrassella sp. W8135]
MDIKNLYALLNIKPTASRSDIAKAMKQAAQQQTITLEDLKLCKLNLLDVEARKQYNARLFAEYPELLTPPPEPESVEKAKPQPPAKTKQGNKKLYLILVVVIALITGTAVYFMHSKLIAEAKEAVRNTLKNLDSAEFYHVEMSVNTHYKEHLYVCGEVEGKTLDGGYTGIKKFVYRLKSKKAIVISNKRSNDIMLEYADSFTYRVGCLNADPAELIKVVKTTDTYLEELRSLTWGPAPKNNFEREELTRAINNVIAKIKADRKKITIYADSDDD